jgi:hypothetical protein
MEAATNTTIDERAWPALTLAGGALAVVAAFMPWLTVSAGIFTVSRDGIDGDGQITALAGVFAALVGFFSLARSEPMTKGAATVCLILAFGIGGVGSWHFMNTTTGETGIQPASGLYLTIVAGGLAVAGAIGALKLHADRA